MKRTKTSVKARSTLPDLPLHIADLPAEPPAITQSEIREYEDAALRYQIAQADWQKRRADITLKLLQCCEPEQGDFSAELDEAGNLVVSDSCSKGSPRIVR